MRADLHTHTVYSDGRQTPDELAEVAQRKGLAILAVTDHDNMDGNAEKRRAIEKRGMIYIPGWEISAYLGEVKIHVTGYLCDDASAAYRDFMRERYEGSYLRAEDSIRKFQENGFNVTMKDAEACRPMPSSPLHTMHVARAVAKKGYFSDEIEVYEKCMTRGNFAFSDLCRPSPYDAIRVIHASGGICSLAHPGRIDMQKKEKEELLSSLVKSGLDGIEAVYTTHTVEETQYYKALAKEHGILVTGGSDTHLEGFGGRRVGEPYFEPDEALLNALRIAVK